MTSVRFELDQLGHGRGIVAITGLSHGAVCDAWLVTYEDGSRLVAKTSLGAPPDLFSTEASGLEALARTGYVTTVRVLAVNERVLLLEALAAPSLESASAWERLAGEVAALHRGTVGSVFGWESDGYLGWLPQENAYAHDGHRFFAERRLLRYLREPPAEAALERADRSALERLCERLPEIVPAMPPVLTHGDLWSGNLLDSPDGHLVLADPAVSYAWAETDLSMLWCTPRPPASERFFAHYHELNPSPPGWENRMPILYLREVLSTIAHFQDNAAAVVDLRRVLAPFYPAGKRSPG